MVRARWVAEDQSALFLVQGPEIGDGQERPQPGTAEPPAVRRVERALGNVLWAGLNLSLQHRLRHRSGPCPKKIIDPIWTFPSQAPVRLDRKPSPRAGQDARGSQRAAFPSTNAATGRLWSEVSRKPPWK